MLFSQRCTWVDSCRGGSSLAAGKLPAGECLRAVRWPDWRVAGERRLETLVEAPFKAGAHGVHGLRRFLFCGAEGMPLCSLVLQCLLNKSQK